MAILYQDGNRLVRKQDGEKLWIEPWGKNALRVRATFMAEMPEETWALLGEASADVKIEINEDGSASVSNGNVTAMLSPGGALKFVKKNGDLVLEEQWYTRAPGGFSTVSSLEIKAREFRPILGGDYELNMRFEPQDEKIFGMGQYQDGCLDKKGCELELAHRNSQASVPFYLSTNGYGFLWNNPGIGHVTFAKNKTEWSLVSTKILDYWICVSDDPSEIMSAYADATGHSPMMPNYGMGFWQCKLRYRTQEELMAVAREHKRRGLPMDVIVSDFFHWPYQGDWRFDPLDYPDPDAMVKELKELGIELMVSIWPFVDVKSENYQEMKEKGYLIRVDRGVPYSADFCGNILCYDATNPEARDFVWSVAKKNYYDKGIKIFWLDEAEPEYKIYDFDLYRYHLGPNVQIGNLFPLMYARNFFEGMQAEGQQNPLNLLRCAWAGSQRYGALVWSGDIDTTFRTLREQFAAGLSMAMAGIPWWTTDIGGFHGGDQEDPDYRELLIRWFQFGAFCPVFRLHGNRLHGEPSTNESKADTGGPNEVWSYGEEAYEILKQYLFLREDMKPYIEKTMQDVHEEGAIVMSPLWYSFPTDKAAAENEDEYMFGKDVLVAPVMELGLRQRPVYLPEGETWIEASTGKEYQGGQTITADAPLSVIPVFVKKGADVSISIKA
ncbi:family 31 glucosidase [Eubacteriales bacterium OttesenSCG-928-N13]|nr:family 31 glucosidase [Eubacteriales bacterium OttesenSCG-928-N13]